jgi:hypothetical protein
MSPQRARMIEERHDPGRVCPGDKEEGPCHVGLHRRYCRSLRPWCLTILTSYRKESHSEGRPALNHPIHATRCLDEARDHAGTKATFGKALSAAVPGLTEFRPEAKKPGEIRPRHYRGLRLKKPKDEAADEAARKALEKLVVG